MKTLTFLFSFLLLASVAFAQTGMIRGTVIEDATGEPLIGVTVMLQGTSTGTATDLDGKFEIKTAPGTYSLQISYVTYKTIVIEQVEVKAGEVNLFDNIRLLEDVETLAEVVITAEAVKVTEEALLTVKRRSVNLIDGISAANFRKIGDSNAAAAVRRVPGVSIEGGKYVYVRGLGDRYTKSTLNGVDIPGLDPDRNTVQMDIFPTNVIDNIIVLKSFTADLPADFTGGVVDIATKDFPDERVRQLSLSLGFNPSMHFNPNYLGYEGGKTDFLGFDDGTRDIPTAGLASIPSRTDAFTNPAIAQQFNQILQDFNPTLAAMRQRSFMDFGLGFSLGDQVRGDRVTWGYSLSATYKNSTEYYEGVKYGRYGKSGDASVTELDPREVQTGDYGTNTVLGGLMAGVAMKTQASKIRFNLLRLQHGESTAGIFQYSNTDQGANFEALQHNLEYTQRSLSNALLHGKHRLEASGIELDWRLSATLSEMNDPDIRFTRYRTDSDRLTIGTESGNPERIWRSLEETNYVARFDASKAFEMGGRKAKASAGASYVYKDRAYNIENFQIVPGSGMTLTGDPNELFQPANLWSSSNMSGLYYDAQFFPSNPNKYDGQVRNLSFYTSFELPVAERLQAIVGLRAEAFRQLYSGENQNRELFVDFSVIDDVDFFPSANLIFNVKDNQNLRASVSRTIARPSFKEASFATIIDPITGRTFVGGLFPDIDVTTNEVIWDGNLRTTKIANFDLRWETFQEGGQTFAVSAFFKSFADPIEMVQYVQIANNFQPRNVGDGRVMGLELEWRKRLAGLAPALQHVLFQSNVTVASSRIEMSATEYTSRLNNARDGESVKNTRAMAGQAPYIVNAGFVYDSPAGLEAGLYYNVQGRTLQFVGIADRPDIYSVPFHGLNLAVNKTFGADERIRLGLNIDNLLGDKREQVFRAYEASSQYFSQLAPGRRFSFSLSYSL